MNVTPEVGNRTDGGETKRKLEGRCRMCQRDASVRPLTMHHLVPRAYFKTRLRQIEDEDEWLRVRWLRDADANLVPLCEPCHKQVEHDPGHRQLLRKVLAPIEATYCIQVRGLGWFDRHYPPVRRRRPPVHS